MREYSTNTGKKDTRQFNQILNKAVKEGVAGTGSKDIEGRAAPRQHSIKKRKAK